MSGTDARESNPNAAGPQGLRGGMGVSSERTGPFGGSEDESADEGVQGTGSRGTAAQNTEGTMSTERKHPEEPAEGRRDIDEAGADSASNQDDSGSDGAGRDPEAEDDTASIDRTVGESNTAEVPSQEFDPSKNPGHSHG
jgi:hypothetical protein